MATSDGSPVVTIGTPSRSSGDAIADAAPAALRDLDWRFLLPRPASGRFARLVLLGASSGERRLADRQHLADQVSDHLPAARSADAIVVRSSARVSPSEVAAALVPGGVLYVEVDRRVPGMRSHAPRRLRAALARAGLVPTGTYIPVGSLAAPRALIPLDVAGALDWYLRVVARSATPAARAMEAALGAARLLGSEAIAALSPIWVMTAVAPGGVQAGVPSAIDGAPGLRDVGYLRPLLMVQGGDRVVVLPFEPGRSAPVSVVKVPRATELSGRTETDQRTLAELHARLPASLSRAIPRPLGTARIGTVTVAAESVMPGATMLRTSGRWGAPLADKLDDLRRAASWLAELHIATEVRRVRWNDGGNASLERPAAAFDSAFRLTAEEERLLERARAYGAAIGAVEVPVVLQHRDFNPWNIVRDGDAIGVVDWEGAQEGTALIDLVQLATNWLDAARGATDERTKLAHYGELFLSGHAVGEAARGARATIGTYLSRTRMDARLVPLLVLASWLELAVRREEQRHAHGEHAGDARADNRAIPFIALLARQPERLFGDAPAGGPAA